MKAKICFAMILQSLASFKENCVAKSQAQGGPFGGFTTVQDGGIIVMGKASTNGMAVVNFSDY
jgi:hypothetical protein